MLEKYSLYKANWWIWVFILNVIKTANIVYFTNKDKPHN